MTNVIVAAAATLDGLMAYLSEMTMMMMITNESIRFYAILISGLNGILPSTRTSTSTSMEYLFCVWDVIEVEAARVVLCCVGLLHEHVARYLAGEHWSVCRQSSRQA